jgi:hypothetical protein
MEHRKNEGQGFSRYCGNGVAFFIGVHIAVAGIGGAVAAL